MSDDRSDDRSESDIDIICGALIGLVQKEQNEAEERMGEPLVLTIEVPIVTLLSLMPIHVWAMNTLREDIKPESYEAGISVVDHILHEVMSGLMGQDQFKSFDLIATLREAGVDVTGATIGGVKIDIPEP